MQPGTIFLVQPSDILPSLSITMVATVATVTDGGGRSQVGTWTHYQRRGHMEQPQKRKVVIVNIEGFVS